jgi:hypothetical protein
MLLASIPEVTMSLTGVWMNELNSVMILNEHTDKGLTGKYRSMVGRDPNVRDLSGRTSALDGEKQMVAFAVCFEIAEPGRGEGHSSVCAWSGWSEKDGTGKYAMETHWLLSGSVLDKQAEWGATKIGKSIFQKVLEIPDEKVLTDDDALKKLHNSLV